MHKIEIEQKKVTREFPSEIEEMNQSQYVCFIDLILQYLSGDITVEDIKVKLLVKLLNIKSDWKYYHLPEDDKLYIHSELYRLSELLETYFKTEIRNGNPVKVFNLNSTRNFVPRIGKYLGPEDALKNCTFAEFRTAHNYFSSYVKDGDEDDLNRLAAVLYRPKRSFLLLHKLLPWFDGRIRTRFTARSNPLFFENRVKKLAKFPIALRYSVFLYFSGCEEYFRTGKPVVDGKEIDFAVLYEKSEAGEESAIGMIGLLYSLAETKVFGSIESTDNQNVWDIMIRLYQVVMQAKQIESKYGSNKGL